MKTQQKMMWMHWLEQVNKLLFSFILVCFSGCFMVQIEEPITFGERIQVREHFFFWGLVGESRFDLERHCPSGVAAFGDRFTPADIGYAIITLGLYAPRTVEIVCDRSVRDRAARDLE